jgi:hypothetical protein
MPGRQNVLLMFCQHSLLNIQTKNSFSLPSVTQKNVKYELYLRSSLYRHKIAGILIFKPTKNHIFVNNPVLSTSSVI